MPEAAAGSRQTFAAPGALARSVVLVGLMGAGKTSVGRRLADALGARFVDSDEEIERAAGMDVPSIFANLGEPAFRDGERRVIRRLLDEPPLVLATGGGAFMDPRTRDEILGRAASVWLRADLDTLVERTARRADRPLLRKGDPREILARLMRERHPVYAEADVTIDSARDGAHEAVVGDILRALAGLGALGPAR